MFKSTIKCLLLAATALFFQLSIAQNFPVQCTVIPGSPYTPVLADYALNQNQLSVQLLHKDFITPVVDVHLKLVIEGPDITIQTKSTYNSNSIFTLIAGKLTTVSGLDFVDLFNPDNLDFQGISNTDFVKRGGVLPEGLYRFSLRAFDTERNLPVSNIGTASLMLFLHSPPLLNLPFDGSVISPSVPQNIVFQWTARHSISPSLTGNIQYKLRIIEVLPVDRNVNDVFQSTSNSFFETFTDQTTFVFGPTEPSLVTGRRYAFQVQAIDVNGLDLFENKGLSEVFSFYYGDDCLPPTGLSASISGGTAVNVAWDSFSIDGQSPANMLYYRKQGLLHWNSEIVPGNVAFVSGLQPSTIYEIQVSRLCSFKESSPSSSIFIKTDSSKGAWSSSIGSCGKTPPKFSLASNGPLLFLNAGDKFAAADFEIFVLSADGDNGVFSGNGLVKLPFTGDIPLPVTFDDVGINSDYRLISGKISVLQKPLSFSNLTVDRMSDRWRDLFGSNWNVSQSLKVQGAILSVKKNSDGTFAIESTSGSKNVILSGNLRLKGENGKDWFISADGTIIESEGLKEEPVVIDEGSGANMPGSILPTAPIIKFEQDPSDQFGYDAYELRQKTAGLQYDRLDGPKNGYYVAWKFVQTGKRDKVLAKLHNGLLKVSPDSIRFVRSDGTILPFKRLNDTLFEIEFLGRQHLWIDAIWAVTNVQLDVYKRIVLGKINIVCADIRHLHIIPVSVNQQGGKLSAVEIQQEMNAMSTRFGVKISIGNPESISLSSYNPESDKIKVDRKLLHTSYGNELNQFINKWESMSHQYPGQDTAVIFLLGSAVDDTRGYMGLNNRYGFIFSGNSPPQAHTLLHEVAHGLLVLEHTFGEDETNARKSLNLLDYSAPYALTNLIQWKRVHDKQELSDFLKSIQQEKESGKYNIAVNNLNLPASYKNSDGKSVNYITPSGQQITLSDLVTDVRFSAGIGSQVYPGCLISFTNNGIYYEYQTKGDKTGYYDADANEYKSLNKTDQKFVALLPTAEGQGLFCFETNNLPQSNGAAQVFEWSEFPVQLFDNNCKWIEQADFQKFPFETEPSKVLQLEADLMPRIYYEQQQILGRHIDKPTYSAVLGLISVFVDYPYALKTAFTSEFEFDGWNEIDAERNDLGEFEHRVLKRSDWIDDWKNSKPVFYENFSKWFLEFAKTEQENALKLLKRLTIDDYSGLDYPTKISRAAAIVSEADLETGINAKQRAFGLDVLCRGRVDDDREFSIIRLIENTGDEQLSAFLNVYLSGYSTLDDGELLLKRLYSAVDDETMGVGQDNEKLMTLVLSRLAIRCDDNESAFINAVNENPDNRRLHFVDQTLYSKVRDFVAQKAGFEDVYATDMDANIRKNGLLAEIEVQLESYQGGFSSLGEVKKYYKPFDLLYVTNQSKVPGLVDLPAAGSEAVLPAIALVYYDEVSNLQFAEDLANTSLDVISIVTGSYSFRLAGTLSKWRNAIAISDVTAGISGIALQTTRDDNKYATLNTLLNSMQVLNGGLSLTDLARSGKGMDNIMSQVNGKVLDTRHAKKLLNEIQTQATALKQLPELDDKRVEILATLKRLKTETEGHALAKEVISAEKAMGIADAGGELKRLDGLVGGGISIVFFKNADDFALTFDKTGDLGETIRNQAFELYKQGNWKELETFFINNNLNKSGSTIWPPAYGGYNIIDNVKIKAGQKFDRYGFSFGNTVSGNPNLGGNFTSPIENGNVFSFGQRALNKAENEYDFYYEIEVLQDLPFTAQNADVIPWFNQAGNGKQSLWNIPKNPNSAQGYSYTLSELAEMGMIKITIKSSPSGKMTKYVNTIIEKR